MAEDRFSEVTEEYDCNICGTTFRTPHELERHIKRDHPDEREGAHHCDICNTSFNTKGQIRRHFHKRHGGISDIR